MSREIFYDFVACDVLVDHPYEPQRCNHVMADILVFRHSNYGSVYDSSPLIVKFLYGEISRKSLYQDYGIYIVKLFHDPSLLRSTFSICKEFFDYFDLSREYEHYYKIFVDHEVT